MCADHETSCFKQKKSDKSLDFSHTFGLTLTSSRRQLITLTDLTKKQVSNKIPWTAKHQHAFDLLKQNLCNATKLHVFEFGKPCGLLVDASNVAVGCCLIQWTEGKQEKPIAFASCKLTASQSAMSTIEREAYAVIYV